MTKERCERWMGQVELELKRNPKYKLGTDSDCSGMMAKTRNDALKKEWDDSKITKQLRVVGVPVRRSNTARMLKNLDGWNGTWIFFETGKTCDLPFYDFKKSIYKHVGVFTRNVAHGSFSIMAHASSSKGFTQDVVERDDDNYFYKHLINVLRLDQ